MFGLTHLLPGYFTVFTDHGPLKGQIMRSKDAASRLLRFRHKLSEYSFDIEYKAGSTNTGTDALRRIPYPNINFVT